MRLETATQNYLSTKDAEGASAHTLRAYQRVLNNFIAHTNNPPLDAIRPTTVAKFLQSEQRRVSRATVEHAYRVLQTFFNWCEIQDEAFQSPIGHGNKKTVKRPRVNERIPTIASSGEVVSLLNSIEIIRWTDARDRAMLSLLVESGIRVGELVGMHDPDVDLDQHTALVHGKGGRDRVLPITPEASYHIWTYIQMRPTTNHPNLWLSSPGAGDAPGKPLQTAGVRYILAQRCKQAGVRRLNPHALRHYSATYMLNNGMDISSVQALLGHADQRMTQHYARWQAESLRNEHARVWRSLHSR